MIDEANDKILVAAFTNELWKGKSLFPLYKNDPKTMSHVLYRETKYINAKDALLARKERSKKRERQEDTRKAEDERWQERGNEGMTGALSPRRIDSRASPH